jgi:hypothetical protein
MFVTFANGKTWSVDDNVVSAVVDISLADIIDHDHEWFLDAIADLAVGDVRLMDIGYETIGSFDDMVRLRVSGDVSEIFNDQDGDIKILDSAAEFCAALGRQFGWNDVETTHARNTAAVTYDNECVIPLANGRELRCPASPEACDYIRLVEGGHELMYWSSDEWAEDPGDVMGAILGSAHIARADTAI